MDDAPRTAPDTASAAASADEDAFQGRIYDRDVAFMTTSGPETLRVPLFFRSRTRPGAVGRTMRGWLSRDGSWDAFLDASWQTPPSRVPWRLLPRGPFRIIVGDEDAMDRFIYEEGGRFLEVGFGSTLVTWSGQRGETFRLQEASLLLSDMELEGVLLDMARAREADDDPFGDWAFLTSGDSLQMILEDPDAGADGEAPGDSVAYRAWARLDFRDTQWPDVAVRWTETRAFEPARRQVPSRWLLTTGDGELEGELTVETTHLEAGAGEGPILPVSGYFEVGGVLRVQGVDYPVRGLVRHRQR